MYIFIFQKHVIKSFIFHIMGVSSYFHTIITCFCFCLWLYFFGAFYHFKTTHNSLVFIYVVHHPCISHLHEVVDIRMQFYLVVTSITHVFFFLMTTFLFFIVAQGQPFHRKSLLKPNF